VIRVTRVRSIGTITEPAVRALIERAAMVLPDVPPKRLYEEIVRRINEHALGVFVGFADGQPKTLVVAELPTSVFQLWPVVTAAYSAGAHPELVHATGTRLREWITVAGFDHACALNMQHTDRSFTRGLAHFGRSKKVGSVIRFNL
jgi:hypothetical protein